MNKTQSDTDRHSNEKYTDSLREKVFMGFSALKIEDVCEVIFTPA